MDMLKMFGCFIEGCELTVSWMPGWMRFIGSLVPVAFLFWVWFVLVP